MRASFFIFPQKQLKTLAKNKRFVTLPNIIKNKQFSQETMDDYLADVDMDIDTEEEGEEDELDEDEEEDEAEEKEDDEDY